MEEFAGVSGVWTTGGCEEESAGAVEVVNFFFFSFFWVMGMGMGMGFAGEGETTFSVFNEERREGGVGGGVFGEGEKELWIYTPLSDFLFAFWFGSAAS